MRLFIAEKPSLARAIAEALPTPRRRSGDAIHCGDSDVVAWCAGHILSMAPPDAYNPDYRTWRLEQLPIVPLDWKLVVSASCTNLLKTIRTLLKSASVVVHAGDPDREGQLLVDEVLEFLGHRGKVLRLLVRDLSPDAVRRAIGLLDPNETYRPLYNAALARQRADWLYGMNLTRLYTLLGQAGGYRGILSVGRVQTPVLGLIVRRDAEIASFRPTPFFVVQVDAKTEDGRSVRATWQAGPSAPPSGFDGDGRLVDKKFADELVARLTGSDGSVTASTSQKRREAAPLPYSLADVQIDAAKLLGLTAEETLNACQRLYETHRLITYPRSDCSYLPEGQLAQAPTVLGAVAKSASILATFAQGAAPSARSAAWNDRKVTAHHALIPTATAMDTAALPEVEREVYALIARRYLMQFYPPCELLETRLELCVREERFLAQGTEVTALGWKALLVGPAHADNADEEEPSLGDAARVPPLPIGTALSIVSATAHERKTSPPKPFTDASLIAAMCNISRHVTSANLKKILKETDGIGTPATRANIIETLFERGYVERQKKTICSTPTGRALISTLPELATLPDLTAVWETAMREIQEGRKNLDTFLTAVSSQIAKVVEGGKKLGKLDVPSAVPGAFGAVPSKPSRPPDARGPSRPSRSRRRSTSTRA